MNTRLHKYGAVFLGGILIVVVLFSQTRLVSAAEVTSNDSKVNICHTTGDGWNVLNVSESAVQAHLGHGDFLYQGPETVDDSWCAEHIPDQGTITVVATKIVCDNEADLPNWGSTTQAITATTATDFLAQHSNCRPMQGWQFQWSHAAPSPGDNYQLGGAGWNTFGPTDANGVISVVVPATNDISLREEMRAGYLKFSGIDDHHNGYSAEFVCGAPTVNHLYNNRENLGPVTAGGTYYCVAFNVPVERTPAPAGQCSVVSDTTNKIKYPDQYAVETYVHPNWVHPAWMDSVPFAKWIWVSKKVSDPVHSRTITFLKDVYLDKVPSSATIELAADNAYEVRINDSIVARKISEHNYESTASYPVTNLKVGLNKIKITVQNFGLAGSTPETNPAGLLYWLDIDGANCTSVQQ